MSEYIRLTIKNKSKITYKNFFWRGDSNKDTISYVLNINKNYYLKKYFSITKEIEKKLSKHNIIFEEYNLVKYSYISEHCIYTTPNIIDILKTIVFLDLIKDYKKKIIHIEIKLKNSQIVDFIKQNFKSTKYVVIQYKKYLKLSSFVPEFIKGNILFLRLFILNFRFINKNVNFKDKFYFISYLNKKELSAKANFKVFFGDLYKLLEKSKIKYSIIFHSLQDNLPSKAQVQEYKKKNISFFRSELNLNNYLIAYLQYIKIFFKTIKIKKKEIFYNKELEVNLYSLFKKQYTKSFYGVKCPETILNIICSKKIINKIPNKSKIIYIAENQSWEKFLIKEAHNRNINTYGTIHSLVNKWDLRFNDIFSKKNLSPTRLLINGKYNRNIINNYIKNYPYNYIEAQRYSSLKKQSKNLNKKNILICGSIEFSPTINMLNEISKSKKIISNYNLVFKFHPANILDLSSYKFLKPYKKKSNYHLTIGPDPTSVIVDFYLRGIPYITYLTDEHINSNFFKILKTNLFFTNFSKLENIIFNKKYKLQIKNYNQIFFLDNKLKLWEKFLDKIK
jgi:hypothetical protein